MKNLSILLIIILIGACNSVKNENPEPSLLKEAYKGKFLIGVALSTEMVDSPDPKIQETIKKQFNSIVAEDCMKCEVIQPSEGVFDFDQADRFVKLGVDNDMFIIGHNLVWHSQAPDWLFVDTIGAFVSREVLIERMRSHIYALAGRYKGKIHGWDVVNEAIVVNDPDGLRNSKWKQIIGDDYIELAFTFAHEADPGAELYYNDYSLNNPKKREATIRLIKRLQQKGIPIHGVGMQAHYGLDTDLNEVEKSIVAFSELGIKVMFTEIDISVLPFPSREVTAEVSKSFDYESKYNPYADALPDSVQRALADKYESLFNVLLKHENVIERATFWGLHDGVSWKNNWPIEGRTDYPLLFDRNLDPKPAYDAVIQLVN